MLIRQKVILALLEQAGQPLRATVLMKLVFLLREKTTLGEKHSFYDFVPYKYGPHSFSLYRELKSLRRDGYIRSTQAGIELIPETSSLTRAKVNELPAWIREVAAKAVQHYGSVPSEALLRFVYRQYPWYATRSQLRHLLPEGMPMSAMAPIAIYTVGYQGRSVDAFFNLLLQKGISAIVDVRANPFSRSSGFTRQSLFDIGQELGLHYEYIPELGIPSVERKTLDAGSSRQQLLDQYEHDRLPRRRLYVDRLAEIVRCQPSALLCLEADPLCCHRSRLALVLSSATRLPIVHL